MVRKILGSVAMVSAFMASSALCAWAALDLALPKDCSIMLLAAFDGPRSAILFLAPIFSILLAVAITIGDILTHYDIKSRKTWGLVLVVWLFNVVGVLVYWWNVPRRSSFSTEATSPGE
jgi:hypothetical protein